jgi:hypothetical protein
MPGFNPICRSLTNIRLGMNPEEAAMLSMLGRTFLNNE